MRHEIGSYGDGNVRVAFCVFCSCEDTLQLLDDECPGKFINKDVDKKVDKDTEPK